MSRKVAIVGGANTRRLAPYADDTWEIWAYSSLRLTTPRITRWFEMHALEDLRDSSLGRHPNGCRFKATWRSCGNSTCRFTCRLPIRKFLTASATP